MPSPDVVVVGGGVIGSAIARHVASKGARVLVLERDRPGAHASWAAAGMLSPLAEADGPSDFLTLLRDSRAMFPTLAEDLREETGIDVAYRREGTLLLALTDADEAALARRHEWQSQAGLRVDRLTGRELRRLEPDISPDARAGLFYPEDHQVDNRLLSWALAVAMERAGAEVRTGTEVTGVVRTGNVLEGVRLRGGETVRAGRVVLAAGCWAAGLERLPRRIPVEPVHGQLVAVQTPPPSLRHVIHTPRAYLVPREDGRLIAGTTVERTGFRKAVTPAGLISVLGGALEAVPALAGSPVLEHWSGLRPGTPDGLPILGRDPDLPELIYATGHYRNGILLGPATAVTVGELALGGESPRDLAPFSIARFPQEPARDRDEPRAGASSG